MIFTGTGPILILTSFESLDDSRLVQLLRIKGVTKYIAYEIPVDKVKEQYGQHYHVVMGDRGQTDELRVVDHDGQRVFYNFGLDRLGEPIYHEEPTLRKAA